MTAYLAYQTINQKKKKKKCTKPFTSKLKSIIIYWPMRVSDGSDHRACCSDRGVPRRCLEWCRGEPVNNKMCVLSYSKSILACFHELRGTRKVSAGNTCHRSTTDLITIFPFSRQTAGASDQRARGEHGRPHGHGEMGSAGQKPADRWSIQVITAV